MPKPAPTGIFIEDKLSFSFLFPEWKFCQSHGGGLSCRLAATSGTTWMRWTLQCWPCSTCGTALLSGSFRLSWGCMCSRFIYLLCLSVLSTRMCTVCVPGAWGGWRKAMNSTTTTPPPVTAGCMLLPGDDLSLQWQVLWTTEEASSPALALKILKKLQSITSELFLLLFQL